MSLVSFRDRLCHDKPVLCDGAMGTLLYQQGVFVNRCYEAVCLENSNQVVEIHKSYMAAGAEVIETNTFGANAYVLGQYGLEEKVSDINRKAVVLARSATHGADVYVAGSVGQIHGVALQSLDLETLYGDQIRALVESGVDVLSLETFSDIEALRRVLAVARSQTDIPLMALVAVNAQGHTSCGKHGAVLFETLEGLDADVVGFNCSVGPPVLADLFLCHGHLVRKPFCVHPNAGGPQWVNGRLMNLFSETFFAKYLKRFVQMGIRVVGGCCGVHPNHINEAYETLRQTYPRFFSSPLPSSVHIDEGADAETPLAPPESRLFKSLNSGAFVLSVELTAPLGMSSQVTLNTVDQLVSQGVTHINVPDGPRASSRMSALLFSLEMARRTPVEPILHYCLRDKNMLAIQGELLAAREQGLANLLVVTGDPPKVGHFPQATGVFDFDSVGLLKMLQGFNSGRDFGGSDIQGFLGSYCVGSGFNHATLNVENEVKRMQQKIESGAMYLASQPVFSVAQFFGFLAFARKRCQSIRPVFAGVWPLYSLRNALFIKKNVPGIEIEDHVIDRLSKYENVVDQRKVGQDIALQVCEKIMPEVQGIVLSAPFNKFEVIEPIVTWILRNTRKLSLKDRKPARAGIEAVNGNQSQKL